MAIGIDLGTSNSCVGVVRFGRVEIIANDEGERTTPSFVAFTDEEQLVGEGARENVVWDQENTIFDAKRLIGRKYDDPEAQKKMDKWPFKVINQEGNPRFEVIYEEEKKRLSPEEISSMVLIKMKEIAEDYVGSPVTDAVITVPAYFNDSQRQATMDAGVIAGLNVLSLLNEPTAAAIAYGVDKKVKDSQKILVFDLGGGTFDVAILAIENGNFEVLAVNGDTHLGGGDFDDRLMDHLIEEFKKKKNLDISDNHEAIAKLRMECEAAKRKLSFSLKQRIKMKGFYQGKDFDSLLTRGRFEDLCSDLFETTLEPVEIVLRDAKLAKSDIDEVVLAGGSTRIPKIQELLQELFQGKNLNKTINPDEAVAYGAALFAATLIGESSVDEIALTDVTPFSIGINVLGGRMSPIIHRNSKLPTQNTRRYTTACHNQTAVDIKVYEGVNPLTIQNHLLGEFTLEGIQVALKGVALIDVAFMVDKNGILSVSAVDTSTNSKQSITITSNKGRLDKKEIERMAAETKVLREAGAAKNEEDKSDDEKSGLVLYDYEEAETASNKSVESFYFK